MVLWALAVLNKEKMVVGAAHANRRRSLKRLAAWVGNPNTATCLSMELAGDFVSFGAVAVMGMAKGYRDTQIYLKTYKNKLNFCSKTSFQNLFSFFKIIFFTQ